LPSPRVVRRPETLSRLVSGGEGVSGRFGDDEEGKGNLQLVDEVEDAGEEHGDLGEEETENHVENRENRKEKRTKEWQIDEELLDGREGGKDGVDDGDEVRGDLVKRVGEIEA